MLKTLVVGGAGYIGSHFCNKLDPGEYIVLDNLSAGHIESVPQTNLIVGDYGDKELLGEIFERFNIGDVVIFAAFASVPDSLNNPSKYYKNNIAKLIEFMDICTSHKVNNVVFSSSASVYGVPENSPIREDHPKIPISPYGLTKLFGENLLLDFSNAYGINVSCIRYFNAAGSSYKDNIGESHSPEEHLIPRLIQRAIANEQIELFGNDYNTHDGYAIRDFVHVEDLAELHMLALNYNRAKKKNLIINAGSGVGYSVREILHKISELIPIKSYADSPRRKGDPDILVADIAMAEQILGWKPTKSIDDIIMSALEWERTRKY